MSVNKEHIKECHPSTLSQQKLYEKNLCSNFLRLNFLTETFRYNIGSKYFMRHEFNMLYKLFNSYH